ncbi:WD and tetratricopeptide repeats protein 1 [Eumeta japonica]|uniref:WD and tetratricopeptide repeats protein 1 n=1 Tax=Eumeta variegata TaxID=151549 RepID=A0A4C1VNC4_EUMVA|nr:WD and tetratricopeptide repeats protein 1 [Eumeta japonica]
MDLTRKNFRAMTYYDFWRGLTQNQCIDRFTSTSGKEAPSKTTIYHWFSEISRGQSVLTDEYIDVVRELIMQGPHVTYHEIKASLAIRHLSMDPNEHSFPKKATTYVAFSHDGNELLVNLGSEQVYLFDINSARRPVLLESFIIEHNHGRRRSTEGDGKCASADPRNGTNGTVDAAPYPLPDDVRQLKEMANDHVNKNNYVAAVEMYGSAISRCPDCAILYSNRAAALMRRAWAGDTYAAVRDCYRAIHLDPTHVKSHFRLAKALMDMRRSREAHECLLYFKDKFPRHANSHAVFLLQKDINVALENIETQPDEVSSDGDEGQATSALERQLRSAALDYSQRFLGHCNTTTDIKEANFLGPGADFVAAGYAQTCSACCLVNDVATIVILHRKWTCVMLLLYIINFSNSII